MIVIPECHTVSELMRYISGLGDNITLLFDYLVFYHVLKYEYVAVTTFIFPSFVDVY